MPKRKTPETSVSAFYSLDPSQLAEIYRKILASLSVLGEATFEEISAHAKLPKERVWKRLSELHKMDLIYRPGNKRVLKSGRDGFTWMLTDKSLPKTMTTEKALSGKTVSDFSREIQKIKFRQPELFEPQKIIIK